MRRLLLVLSLAVAHAATATGQELAYSSSLQYATGSYIFTESTHTLSLYNGLTLDAGRLRLGLSLPVILQNSGAVTTVGGTYLPTGGEDHEAVGGRQQGQNVPTGGHGGGKGSLVAPGPLVAPDPLAAVPSLADPPETTDSVAGPGDYELQVGDPLLTSAIQLYQGFGLLRAVELTGSVKVPLNDVESGVGTGEWDYGAGGAVALGMGPVLVFLDGTYWWYGDLPGLELRDGVSWGGGLGVPLTGSLWVSAMATRMNRIIENAEAVRSVSAGLSYRTASRGTVSVTAGAGLSETAADFTLSVGWRGTLSGSGR